MTARKAIPASVRRMVLARQSGCCAACGAPLTGVWHLDHVRPLELLGAHDESNFEALCIPCHRTKTSGQDIPRIAKAKRMGKSALPRPPEARKPGSIPTRENPWPPRGSRKLRSRGFVKRPDLREQAGTAVSP